MKRSPLLPSSVRILGYLSATASLAPLSGLTQEALRGAIDGDKAFAARRVPITKNSDYHEAGPVSYSVGLRYGVEWQDNILSSPTDKKADFIHAPELQLNGRWQATSGTVLQFGAGVGYMKYTRFTENDRLKVSPNSELGLDIPLKDFILTFFDRFSYAQDIASQGGLAGVASFPRFENTIGTRLTWQPDRYFAQVGYGHENFVTSSSLFNYLNRSAEDVFGRVGYQVAPKTLVGVESTLSLVNFDQASQADNVNYSVGPFAEWQITKSMKLSLRSGYVRYSFDPTPTAAAKRHLGSYYAGAEVRHFLTDHITHSLSLTRDIQQGLNVGADYISAVRLGYQVEWNFYRSASIYGDVMYEDAKEPKSTGTEHFSRQGYGFGIRYQFTKRLGSTLHYSYLSRSSDQASRDYQVNGVLLSALWRF